MKLSEKSQVLVSALLLILIVLFSFFPSLENGFTNWDDDKYVTENAAIRSLSPENVGTIFTSFHRGLYKPLVFLSFALEYHFFKLDPFVYHATNLILHLLNCLLVFWMIFLVSGRWGVAFVTALFFGIHPLQVESVAWIAERKNMLYGFFILLSLISYLRFQKHRLKSYYFYSLAAFVFSLLTKPMGIALPFILLLFDYLKRRRFGTGVFLEKLPYLLLAVSALILNIFVLREDLSGMGVSVVPSFERFLIAAHGIIFYLGKIIFPVGLSCLYPYPQTPDGSLPPVFFLSAPAVFGLVLLVAVAARRTRKVFFGSLFFLLALSPALGFFPAGPSIAFDHFVYIPLIGIFYLFSEALFFCLCTKRRGFRRMRKPLLVCLVLLVGIFSSLTFRRTGVWRNSLTLWNDALAKYPHSGLALYHRGLVYQDLGDLDRAIGDYSLLIESRLSQEEASLRRTDIPDTVFASAYYNRALAYEAKGAFDAALQDYGRCVKINGRHYKAFFNLGRIHLGRGQFDLAVSDFSRALKITSASHEAYETYLSRGNAYLMRGDLTEAVSDFSHAVSIDSKRPQAYHNRGIAYLRQGDRPRALKDFNRVFELDPDYPLIERMKAFAEKG